MGLKYNFKIGKADLLCRKCSGDNETQEHILTSKELSDVSVVEVTTEQ